MVLDATNMKTGKGGIVLSQYVDRKGRATVEVLTGVRKAYWNAAHVLIKEVVL